MAVYIALEGPDGVGKSTVAAALAAQLPGHVRVRHFPTSALVQLAQEDGYTLRAEDYLCDMESWLAFRPEPVLYPDVPSIGAAADTLYVLDRWAPSTLVNARLRGERLTAPAADRLGWLLRVPALTFVLVPEDPEALTDPDYPGPDPYNPTEVTDLYRRYIQDAFISGPFMQAAPVPVDRAHDTPGSTAAKIAEMVTQLTHNSLDDTADIR